MKEWWKRPEALLAPCQNPAQEMRAILTEALLRAMKWSWKDSGRHHKRLLWHCGCGTGYERLRYSVSVCRKCGLVGIKELAADIQVLVEEYVSKEPLAGAPMPLTAYREWLLIESGKLYDKIAYAASQRWAPEPTQAELEEQHYRMLGRGGDRVYDLDE